MESHERAIEASLCFFLRLPFGTFFDVGLARAGSIITIPLTAGASRAAGVIAVSATLMGSVVMANTSSSALGEDKTSKSFKSILLLFLSSRIERGLFLSLSFSSSCLHQKA